MSGSVNKVILVGRLGADPESRSFNNGCKVVSLSVATSERWKDKQSGEQREKAEWHKVSIFNERLGEVAERFLKKGSSVYLEGALETRKWQDQSGQDKYTTEIVLKPYRGELTLLGGKDSQSGASSGGQSQGNSQFGNYGSGSGGNAATDLDDDIPF